MGLCAEYHRSATNVEDILTKLAELTLTHIQMFRDRDYAGTKQVDKEIELTIGEKERAIGALRQHFMQVKSACGFGNRNSRERVRAVSILRTRRGS